jgi:2-polyprenyl-6-methoxyphenol hydroxylase-like FAD-dependent oxidoreductase
MIADRRVLIVGGGIGGLAVAGALHRRGAHVTVVERASAWHPLGAGLMLSANALAALDALDLGAPVRARSMALPSVEVRSARDTLLQAVSYAARPGRPEAPRGMHRAALHDVLLHGAAGVTVRLGTSVQSIDQRDAQVHVTFSDGRNDTFDLVIGADGVHSQMRGLAFGDRFAVVRYAGYTCWRTVMPNRAHLTGVVELWGNGRRIGLVPLPDAQLYVFLTANAESGARDPSCGAHAAVAVQFREFAGAARLVIDELASRDDLPLLRHDITELSAPCWVRGHVALLGDAGHACTPNLGQGAGMALEDALGLVLALHTHPGMADALSHYQAQRAQRVADIVRTSRRVGQMGQWTHPVARAVRDTAMRLTPAWVGDRSMRALVEPGIALAREAAASR